MESLSVSRKTEIILKLAPEILQNKQKKTVVMKYTCAAVCGLLNSHDGGILKLISSQAFTPAALDELVRGIEQSLIEFLGLTSFRQYCKMEITKLRKNINFEVVPSDRLCTIEYNLVLPTDFLVKQVFRTEPTENIARLLESGPLNNSNLHEYIHEFQQYSIMPEDLRESKKVQFKKIKSDKNKNKSIADRIIANKVTHYIAAFANHEGGHIYIGIDDETYKIYGQLVTEKEKQRIVKKITSAIGNMVWPTEHGKPEHDKHWHISFVPVLDAHKNAVPDLFVIVISIASVPGGVFLAYPEAYVIEDGQTVVRMEFGRWKKRLLHDAHMRDIIKFCREDSWKKNGRHQVAEDKEDKDSESLQNDSVTNADRRGASCTWKCSPDTMDKPTPANSKSRNLCQRITDFMDQLIQDGKFEELQRFASKAEKCESFHKTDVEVSVRFMLALGAYLKRNFSVAYEELGRASSLIPSTENANELEVQRLHLLACFHRGKGDHTKSYEVTYGGLQEVERISPGWHSAWMLIDAGYLFSILAGEEKNQEVRKSLKQQAISLYSKAIAHTLAIQSQKPEVDDRFSILKSNLLHRCHLRLAMVSLNCTPLAEKDSDDQKVTDEEINVAIASILVVEESSLKDDSIADVNACYLYLVKSDLNYRKSQIDNSQCCRYTGKAREWATKARDLAVNDQFHGIIKYAESRLHWLSSVCCQSNVEAKLLAELNHP